MITHSVLGSWPGEDMAATSRMVLGECPTRAHLPELPGRGPHAAMIGRTLGVVSELGADLQPTGWRLTDNAGIDHRRASATLRDDVEIFAEAAQEFSGEIVVTYTGPWTMAAAVELPRGGKVLGDSGARRDLSQALAVGIADHATHFAGLVPDATVRVQLDEPMLPQVAAGSVPTASGFGRIAGIDQPELETTLGMVVGAATAASTGVTVHSCAASFDPRLARRVGADAVSLDLTAGLMATRPDASARWEQVAEFVESGGELWFGAAATERVDEVPAPERIAKDVLLPLRPLELDRSRWLEQLSLTPACGLASWSLRPAISLVRNLGKAAEIMTEELGQ